MAQIVVFGVTGYAGGYIARELVARGHSVVGVSRRPGEVPDGVRALPGDLRDSGFVAGAVAGADVVVLAVRSSMLATPEMSFADLLRDVVLPAVDHAGARLAIVGGAGSLITPAGGRVMDAETFPEAYMPEATQHAEALAMLRARESGPDWFTLSPPAQFGAAFDGPATGRYEVGVDHLLVGEGGVSRISGADYALAFVDEIETPRHERMRFTVVG